MKIDKAILGIAGELAVASELCRRNVYFAGKEETQRPDFYVLTYNDWVQLIGNKMEYYLKKHPDRRIEIRDGCLYYLDAINKSGKPYAGCDVSPNDLAAHYEKWKKITESIKGGFEQITPQDAARHPPHL
jgi:hypothetical protein